MRRFAATLLVWLLALAGAAQAATYRLKLSARAGSRRDTASVRFRSR